VINSVLAEGMLSCPVVHCMSVCRCTGVINSVLAKGTPSCPVVNCMSVRRCRGVINSVLAKGTPSCPVVHCYTAVGHSKAVLSLFADDDFLVTGSKGSLSLVIYWRQVI